MKFNANAIAITALSTVRAQSKMSTAMTIFVDEVAHPSSAESHRARCVARFQTEIGQKPATASTYYDLCSTRYMETAEMQNAQVIGSNPTRIYTAYKCKPGSNIVTARVVLPKMSDTEQMTAGLSFTGLVKGVLSIGDTAPAH